MATPLLAQLLGGWPACFLFFAALGIAWAVSICAAEFSAAKNSLSPDLVGNDIHYISAMMFKQHKLVVFQVASDDILFAALRL